MTALTDFLVQFGGFGMFLSALLAGSIIPFSSELVMTALKLAGVSNLSLLLWGTAGNVLGSSMNYGLGRLGKLEWLEKHAHISKEKMDKAEVFVRKYGPWMALVSWVPILGSAITVALGLLRCNFLMTLVFMTIGKAARYALILYAVVQIQ